MSATPDPDMEYLQPDFDPNSLTMPKLRGILLKHQVDYPSTAKKGQLVDIFEDGVRPRARKLLTASARTKRSTRGIVDMPSSAEASLDGSRSDEEVLPARTPKRGSRRTTQANVEEATPAPASSRSARQSNSRQSRLMSEESTATDASRRSSGMRRTRHSMTPSVKIEEEEEETFVPDNEASAFSTENVFQGGSSPAPEPEPSRDRRRRATGGATSEKKKRSSSRRQTDGVAKDARVTSTSKRSRPSQVTQAMEDMEDEMEAGEEFEPSEAQELAAQEQQQDGAVVRPLRRKAPQPRGFVATFAPLTLTMGLLSGAFMFWRQEKIGVGFCGAGRLATTQIGDIQIPGWARDTVLPSCEPCPPHAYCSADLQLQCEDDFVQVLHPLSLGGLVPLSPTCEPDGEKARKVQAITHRAVEELRERNAKAECGDLRDERTGKKVDSAAVSEPELKASVSGKRHKRMSDSEFEELWHSSLGDIMDMDEVVSDVDSTSNRRTLASTSLARLPLVCTLRRSVRLALVRHLRQLVLIVSVVTLSAYGYYTILSRWEMEVRAKQLATFALDRLADQAAWANYYGDEPGEDGGRVERFVGVSQLRDDVLRDEFSSKRRQRLWERVQKKVEDNSNVRSAVREGRSGEVGRVWEWIGAVGALDFGDEETTMSRPGSSGSGLKRKKSRTSMGVRFDSSPVGSGGRVRGEDDRVPAGLQQWEESRPIY